VKVAIVEDSRVDAAVRRRAEKISTREFRRATAGVVDRTRSDGRGIA
jgi:hypothetical protein